MSVLAVFLLVALAWAGFMAFVIWADTKAQKAHDAWMNHPDRVWNLWKRDDQ